MSHPILLYYKETIKRNHPLILVVGREPDSTTGEPIDDTVDSYDFDTDRSTKNCFWAVAHEAFAHALVDKKPYEFKDECRKAKCSPILITNAGIRCVQDGSGKQREMRSSASNDDKCKHFNNLSKHISILTRVKWIWLSGLDDEVFADYKIQLMKFMKHINPSIKIFCMPYLCRRGLLNKAYREFIKSSSDFKDQAALAYKKFCNQNEME
jgi:hypothetical protein